MFSSIGVSFSLDLWMADQVGDMQSRWFAFPNFLSAAIPKEMLRT